jgi:hypothetical protein
MQASPLHLFTCWQTCAGAAMNDEKTIVETISRAWNAYQGTEKYGLDFGKTCYECQLRVATRGGVGNKGRGIVPTLEQLKIPKSTTYYWIRRYKWSAGLEAPPPEPEDSVLDGSEYADLITADIPAMSEPNAVTYIPPSDGPNMNIAQINASPARCSICGAAPVEPSPYNPCTCTACGLSICNHSWPGHRAGHPPNVPPRRLNPARDCSAPTPDELVRKVEIALAIAISQWPRGESHQQLVEAVEAMLDGMRREHEETEMVGGGRR